MLAFILGLSLSALLIVSLTLEICLAVRPFFSVIFLVGIIGLFFIVFSAGLLLTPLFIFGFILNIPLIILAAIASGGGKNGK